LSEAFATSDSGLGINSWFLGFARM